MSETRTTPASNTAATAGYPMPTTGNVILKDFKFHTGQVMPELRIHYTTVGDPSGQPVLVLHGSGGSAASMLTPGFAGKLFGPGQTLDAGKYYLIIPDSIGHGQSSKPSDGLKTDFPEYDYDDMVVAQYRALTEGLAIKHLRLIIGNSMGGMHTWLWGEKYPDFMDALVPMASQPSPMAARNWLLRRAMIETIRNDPGYQNGHHTTQPPSMKHAIAAFVFGSTGGTLAYQALAPTAAAADALYDQQISKPIEADANDFLYQWGSSRDFDPSPALEKIKAAVLLINSADDERDPPETGVTEQAMERVKRGGIFLIPASTETRGHSTTGGNADLYADALRDFLGSTPQRGS